MAIKKLPPREIPPEDISPPSSSRVTVVPIEQSEQSFKTKKEQVAAAKASVASIESNIPSVKVNNKPTVIKSHSNSTINEMSTEIADAKIIIVAPAGISTTTKTIITTEESWDSSANATIHINTDKNIYLVDSSENVFTVKQPKTVVETIKQAEVSVTEEILPSVDASAESVSVTETTTDPEYSMPTNIVDEKPIIPVFNFDFLSYLFFEININENLPSFYDAVDYIIENKSFERDEDPGTVAPENIIDPTTMKQIFDQIWTMVKDAVNLSPSNISIKNLIGFYIYFNRKLGFLPILVQGTTLNEFLADMTLDSILTKLSTLGLYPISGYNLFERLWNSFTYSVLENANKAETKLSIREFMGYDVNRNMTDTYDGFPNKNDQLIITYKLDPSKWNDKKTFKSDSAAFKRFKELTTEYITDQGAATIKKYLLDLLPVQDYAGADMTLNSSVFSRKSILSVSTNINPPNRQLWFTLQSFDNVFKVNRLEINKSNIRKLFIEFSSSQGFLVSSVQENQYTDLWLSWVSYLNNKVLTIYNTLNTPTDTDHDYKEMYNQLVWLINAKFILQYLQSNNNFISLETPYTDPYTDGADYINNVLLNINGALLKIYQSLTVLKTQLQNVIEYIKQEEKRFTSSSIK